MSRLEAYHLMGEEMGESAQGLSFFKLVYAIFNLLFFYLIACFLYLINLLYNFFYTRNVSIVINIYIYIYISQISQA